MKKLLIVSVLFLFIGASCNNQKESSTAVVNEVDYLEPYWQEIEYTIPQGQLAPKVYKSFKLNLPVFRDVLSYGNALIPDYNGALNSFSAEDSGTMNPELAAKFPNIKSYKGVQDNNPLCSSRITLKDEFLDIAIFCNDLTYYIKQYDVEGERIYIVYNKKDAPEGAGTVNE